MIARGAAPSYSQSIPSMGLQVCLSTKSHGPGHEEKERKERDSSLPPLNPRRTPVNYKGPLPVALQQMIWSHQSIGTNIKAQVPGISSVHDMRAFQSVLSG